MTASIIAAMTAVPNPVLADPGVPDSHGAR